jgi:tetratricopeptide (TPR) repeat protein
MTPFRVASCTWSGTVVFAKRLGFIGLLSLFWLPELLHATSARTRPRKVAPGKLSAPVSVPPSGAIHSNRSPAGPVPEFADALPTQFHSPAPDLLLPREEARKADALAAFAEALLAEDNSDSDKALAGYRKTLEFDPSYAELAVKVAYELARRNDVSAGIQVLKDTIKAAPKEALPLVYLSQLYSKHLKKPDLALKYAEQALALAPDNLLCHSALYELYVAANQPKKAEQVLERATKSNSTDPRYWIQLGDLYTRLYLKEDGSSEPADLEKMNAVYRKAAELGKTDAAIVAKVGDYFVLSRQVKEAIPFYLAALNLKQKANEPPLDKLRDKLARAFMVTQQRDEAIAVLEELTRDQPMRFETYALLGELYEQKGELDKAVAHYEHSLLLDASEPSNTCVSRKCFFGQSGSRKHAKRCARRARAFETCRRSRPPLLAR